MINLLIEAIEFLCPGLDIHTVIYVIVVDQRAEIYGELNEYLQLKSVIEKLKEDGADTRDLKTQVDIGCNFYCEAIVPDASKIFIRVGCGFFVEFTYDEAIRFIDRKTPLLMEKIEGFTNSASQLKAQIKFMLESLRQLQNISSEEETPQRDLF